MWRDVVADGLEVNDVTEEDGRLVEVFGQHLVVQFKGEGHGPWEDLNEQDVTAMTLAPQLLSLSLQHTC
jgi:hypothetical protein